MREAVATSQFTGMVNKRAKTPKETRMLMVELEEKAKKMEDITGESIEAGHYKSVITGMVDMETLRQTVQHQEGSLEKYKRKIMEYVNLIMSGDARGNDNMDLSRVQGQEENQWDPWQQDGGGAQEENEEHGIFGLGELCHTCGGAGHYARECPSKGKGKGGKGGRKGEEGGKGKGPDVKGAKGYGKSKGGYDKGKGKGKGKAPQYGGCWTCGGAHFSRDCPRGKTDVSYGAVKSLSSIQEVLKRTDVCVLGGTASKTSEGSEEWHEVKGRNKHRQRNNRVQKEGSMFCQSVDELEA